MPISDKQKETNYKMLVDFLQTEKLKHILAFEAATTPEERKKHEQILVKLLHAQDYIYTIKPQI